MITIHLIWASAVVVVAVLASTSFDAWIRAKYPRHRLKMGDTGDEADGSSFGECLNALDKIGQLRRLQKG